MRILQMTILLAIVAAFSVPGSLGTGVEPARANSCQESSEFRCCGDIVLVFRNPDLKPESDGSVHAQGQLFAQFQAIGADADKIDTFGFSFSAAPYQNEETVCDQSPWAPSGAYVINYRADLDASDGYFINLQTTLVPDGEYMAAVHAYDSGDTEIARAWTLAEVDNCNDGATANRCDSDNYPTQEHIDHDKTMPWPIMLPGDGDGGLDTSKNNAPSEAQFTAEFAEPLSQLRFFINGELIHDKLAGLEGLKPFEGRKWDDDLIPGYGPYGLGGQAVPECTLQQEPVMACNTLGEAWYWDGRALTDDDIVRIEATDLAGNLARKEIHVGSGAGGAITDERPNLQITVDELSKTMGAGESANFRFELQNTGGTTGHPFAEADGPEGWEITWTPAHKPVPPGQRTVQELGVRAPADAVAATYEINATIRYDRGGGEEKTQDWNLKVNLASGGGLGKGPAGNTTEGGGKSKGSPGAGVVLVPALALAAWAARRRW